MPALTFFLAFVAVLALIGVAAWLVRRYANSRLGANTSRGRMPRLAVIDAAAVDGRRRLVLVRRDNVEHLLMIGGPSDIVVEQNIVRAIPARDQLPQRPPGGRRGAAADCAAARCRLDRQRIAAHRHVRPCRAGDARAAAASRASLLCRRNAPPGRSAADAGPPRRSVVRLHAGADGRPPRAPARAAPRSGSAAACRAPNRCVPNR